MAFTNKPFIWKNNGVTPPETLQNSGFIGGKKLPAPYVNAQWTATYKAIEELQQKAGEVKTVNNVQPDVNGNVLIALPDTSKLYQKPTTGIPKTDLESSVQTSLVKADSALQSVTKSDVGLGNVDNTSDANKPVSTAQQTALNFKANIASPTFTGTPKAPTAVAGTNTTQLATTAFVKNAVDTSATAINESVAAHQADNVSHDTYVTCATAGATAEKVVTANGFTLVEGARITVKFANANTATTPTLKINAEVAKPLVKADGTAFKNIKAGIYSFVYSGSNFTVQGEGGEYGTATASDVLAGKTFGTENGLMEGILTLASLGGKRWASGTLPTGQTANVTGLTFTPSTIFCYPTKITSGISYFAFYTADTPTWYIYGAVNGYTNINVTNPVKSDGFTMQGITPSPDCTIKWIAFE